MADDAVQAMTDEELAAETGEELPSRTVIATLGARGNGAVALNLRRDGSPA